VRPGDFEAEGNPMLTLFHAPTTRSFRIKWLLNELELPHKTVTMDFYGMDRHAPDYRKINPMGSIPAMTDGNLSLTESGAMLNHIIRNYGGGRFSPAGADAALVDEWMYWSEGLFGVHQRIYWDHCAPPPGCLINPVPSVGQEAKLQAIRYAGMLESQLREDGWIVGSDLTGADFMLSFPLFLANLEGWFQDMPKTMAYIARFSERKQFQDAIADTLQTLQAMATTPPAFPSFRSTELIPTS
jgi:glutathione S-transferase